MRASFTLATLLFAIAAIAAPVADAEAGLDSDEQSVLDAHNKYRSQHSADPLTWSSDLASYAASYASSCVFEHTGGNPIILT